MILPIIFGTLGVLGGFYLIIEVILTNLGYPSDGQFRDLPFRDEVKFSTIGLIVFAFFTIGGIIGMFANALVLLTLFKWGKNQVVNALVLSKYPKQWLKSPKELQKAETLKSTVKQKGKWHFIAGNGVLAVGLPLYLLSSVVPALSSNMPLNYEILFILACLWFFVGALFGWIYWIALIINE